MAKNKQPRGKGTKAAAAHDKGEGNATDPARDQSGDPLRAFSADPPQPNRVLLIISAVLFAVWFCFLAYVALRG
jgi:hypothetical protein